MRFAVAGLLLAISVGHASAEIYGSLYRSERWQVELLLPRDWAISEETAYPGLLAVGVHKTGARLTLAVQPLQAGETLKDYVERNQKALRKVGFRLGGVAARSGGAIVIDGTAPEKKKRMRQGYLAHGGAAFVLTLAASTETMPSFLSAFDYVMSSIVFDQPPPASATGAEPPPPPPNAPPDAGPKQP
jgi:hypothetical protein